MNPHKCANFGRNLIQRTFSTGAKFKFYTRENCSLCEEAKHVLDSMKITYEMIDVDSGCGKQYTFDVPVLEKDGKPIQMHKFNPAVIRNSL